MRFLATRVVLLVLVLIVQAAPGRAEILGWSLEWLSGAAWNAPNRLGITQHGYDDLVFDAEFATRPLEQPLYWAMRISGHTDRRSWSLELHHHKLVLENGPPEVGNFSITHGTNIISLQHAWRRTSWRYFVLAGIVAAHPENTVRGHRLPEDGGLFGKGYHLMGPALGIGVGTTIG